MFLRSVSGPGHVALGRHGLRDAEVGQPRLHLAALDLRQVEDIVDHFQQGLARLLDVQHVPLLLFVQGVDRAEDFAKAEGCCLVAVRSSWLMVARKSLLSMFSS